MLGNVWRGNTFIEIEEKIIPIWKGLPKFFDMKPIYLGNMIQQTAYEADLNISIAKALENAIFENVRVSIDNWNLVEIVKTLKINGENAQISYD